MAETLRQDKVSIAMQRIRDWSADPVRGVACPVCEAEGLEISDRSARPHTEWYHLKCAACGLDQTLAIPMAPPQM